MAIPAQRFRVAQGGDYSRSLSVSTGESFKVSFTQLRGSTFGDRTRTFIVERSGERIGTISATESRGQTATAGSANANVTIREPGTYTIRDKQSGKSVSVSVSGTAMGSGFTANQEFEYVRRDPENIDSVPDDFGQGPHGSETQIDPEEYAGIVNAGNDEGIALAPALRREGAALGPEGATVNLPDGETVEVGAISDADEVARYVEGDRAGEVVDADRGAVDGGSTDGTGGVVGAVILVAAAAIAVLGGYN